MSLFGHKNSRKQGDVGLGRAIAYFTALGLTVAIPLTDSQDYDLIVDKGPTLERVQVKTTVFKRKEAYVANLKVCGGNKSGNKAPKPLDPDAVDAIYVSTPDGDYYLPVSSFSCRTAITLGDSYSKYKV